MSPHVSWGVEGHSFSQLRRSDGRIQKGTWEGIDLSVPNLEGGAFCFKYGKRRLWASWWGCPGCVTPYVCARLCDTVCVWERMCDTVCVCQAVWHGVCVCVCVCMRLCDIICVFWAVWQCVPHKTCPLPLPPPPISFFCAERWDAHVKGVLIGAQGSWGPVQLSLAQEIAGKGAPGFFADTWWICCPPELFSQWGSSQGR